MYLVIGEVESIGSRDSEMQLDHHWRPGTRKYLFEGGGLLQSEVCMQCS